MDFWRVIEQRHSVRAFDSRTNVSDKDIHRMIEAAIQAPSAGNCQPWHFIVVRDRRIREALADAAYGQEFVAQAPVVFAVCAEPARSASRYGKRGVELYCLQDTAAAIEHILLAATSLGLGACWVGAFDEKRAAKALDLPPQLRPVGLVPVGKPAAETSRETSRRALTDVVTYR